MDNCQNGDKSTAQLVEFDWNLKVLLGTSSIVAHPPPPLVEVDFHMCDNITYDEKSGNVSDTVKLEMNEQELKTFISVLEKAVNS